MTHDLWKLKLPHGMIMHGSKSESPESEIQASSWPTQPVLLVARPCPPFLAENGQLEAANGGCTVT